MTITRRTLGKLTLGLLGATAFGTAALADSMPAPFDKPADVKIALVRYLSTGDFFQSYLSGVESQAKALGVDLRGGYFGQAGRELTTVARPRF